MNEQDDLRTSRLLWWCFAFSLCLYATVAVIISGEKPPASTQGLAVVKWAFLGASLVPIAFIAYLKKLAFEKRLPLGTNHTNYPQLKRTLTIVSFAFAETPAIFGLIVFFFSRRWSDFYLFMGFAALALITFYPRDPES